MFCSLTVCRIIRLTCITAGYGLISPCKLLWDHQIKVNILILLWFSDIHVSAVHSDISYCDHVWASEFSHHWNVSSFGESYCSSLAFSKGTRRCLGVFYAWKYLLVNWNCWDNFICHTIITNLTFGKDTNVNALVWLGQGRLIFIIISCAFLGLTSLPVVCINKSIASFNIMLG